MLRGAKTWVATLVALIGLAFFAPLSVAASPSEPITVVTQGVITGPTSVAGTFTLSGPFSDSGTYVESFRIEGLSIRGVKTISGSRGTATLVVTAVLRWTSPTTAELDAGHWRLSSGTGDYKGLLGGGSPGGAGSASLATGQVQVVHSGFVSAG